MRFSGKSVFVTGAGGYIGGVAARMFAREGARVAVCDIREDCVHQTVQDILDEGGEAIGVTADVTVSSEAERAVEQTAEAFGRLDIALHAAGGSARAASRPLIEQNDEVIESILRVNLFGGIYVSRAAGRVLVRQGQGGRLLTISSAVAFNGLRGCVDYAASKGGLISMTRSLAKELAGAGITVNTVAPGIVQRPGETNEAIRTNFLGIRCTAEDVGHVILFLASDEAHFVTGQTYVVDGGRGLAMKGTD